MLTCDPIIAVRDLEASCRWYQTLFGCKSYGRDSLKTLTDENGSALLCLHKWGEHEHPTMMDAGITPGNGLILYFRTDRLEKIRENARSLGAQIEEDVHVNPNSRREEFSIRDLDGYYITITRYHDYGHGIK